MASTKSLLEKWKPAVPASVLVLTAGTIWLGTGIMLDSLAANWLGDKPPAVILGYLSVGFFCAMVIHHFGFLGVADKNLQRILPMEGRRCLFSVFPWKSYILVFIMISLGRLLRHAPISKPHLAILYSGIGTALILSSFRYFRFFLKMLREKPPRFILGDD
jgi:hypothetical protein